MVSHVDNNKKREFASTAAMKGLLALAIIAVLYIASDLLVPIAFAILFKILLSPLVRRLTRWHVPAAIAAGILVLGLIGIVSTAILTLAEPAEQWLSDAPTSIRELQRELDFSEGHIANIQELANEVGELAKTDDPVPTQQVVVSGPTIMESLLGGLPAVVGFVGIVVFLTFFLLAAEDKLLRRMTQCGRSWSERRRIVSAARHIQNDLSRYLATVTVINAGLGAAVAAAMYYLDVPNPLLWGAMVYLFNFAPYIGALTSAAILTLVGLMTHDALADALLVPGAFLLLTIIEGQLITPTIVGRQMSLSPVIVFLSVIFWGWLWGIAGALMAVPIVTSLKVICEHAPGLQRMADFLSDESASSAVSREPMRPRGNGKSVASSGPPAVATGAPITAKSVTSERT